MSRWPDEEPDVDEVDSPALAATDRIEEVSEAMNRPDPDTELEALHRLVQQQADQGDRFAHRDAEGIRRRINRLARADVLGEPTNGVTP